MDGDTRIGEPNNMTTQEIISQYESKGWVFKQISFPVSWREGDDVQVAYEYHSPRMNSWGLIYDGFTEDKLLIEESEYYVKQTHGNHIQASVQGAVAGVVQQLGCLYRLKDRGKHVPIPQEIVIKEIVVKIF